MPTSLSAPAPSHAEQAGAAFRAFLEIARLWKLSTDQQLALLGRQLLGVEIGQAGHDYPSESRSGPCSVTPPSTTSTWPVM